MKIYGDFKVKDDWVKGTVDVLVSDEETKDLYAHEILVDWLRNHKSDTDFVILEMNLPGEFLCIRKQTIEAIMKVERCK